MNQKRNSLIFGSLLILLGIVLLLETFDVIHVVGRLVWSIALAGFGLPFLLVFLSNRDQWWALIPGCILVGVGAGVLVGGTMTAIIINASIGLPFLLIYLNDREQWWGLIPAWVMECVAAIILLDWIGLDWFIDSFVMFAIAAPFLVVYVLNRDQWWALIPGGIMTAIGLLILIGETLSSTLFWAVGLMLAGGWMVYRYLRPAPPEPAAPEDLSAFELVDEPDPAAQPEEPR